MKIPTQQNNVKRTALVVTGMAVITGLAIPTTTFAQGGNRAEGGNSWHSDDRRGGHKANWGMGWSWWQQVSAEDFSSWNTQLLSKVDWYIQKNNLEIENGTELRTAVDTNAAAVADSLTTLEELRDSIGDVSQASEEQRAALKEQSTATFSAYYDYKLSLYDYKVAIKAAANKDGVQMDSSIDSEAQ